ncbi:hypothetical protein [Paenisporosarcina sp. NPDC076898]|uniref:hypothetical protein n=1 Tax=unclassified Paenisporosarcina TaxID=2642018 RepID=UPI003D03C2A1
MAVKLVARMSLVDKFTQPMRNVEKQVERNQRALDKMRTKANQTGTAVDKLATSGTKMGKMLHAYDMSPAIKGVGRLTSALNPLNSGFLGIAAAASAAYGAVKIFNSTVGEAMKMQQSEVIIGAMFNDKQLSADYMKMIDKFSINSPLMDSQAMYGNSKSFITQSKDVKQLEKMWNLTERLMASDPKQGLEGSVLALRELFSGDAMSIVERFELPRTVMNEIKKLPLDQQLTKLDDYFNKIGLTTHLIDEMGGTALGMWAQVKERFQLVLRDMGEPSLKAVSTFLGGLLDRLEGEDIQKFATWGGRVIESMVNGLSNNVIHLYDWFTSIANDPEFQSKSTLFGKVDFIVSDIAEKLQAWYDGGGKDNLIEFASDVTETLLGVLNNSKAFAEVGAKLGSSLLDGIVNGLESAAQSSTLGKLALNAYKGTLPGALSNAKKAWNEVGAPTLKSASDALDRNWGNTGVKKGHAAGLDRVPYNGYQPILHKDEKVLTAQQAKDYRNGSSGVNITVQNMSVREESDINKIAMQLARLLEGERGQTA